MRRKLVTLLSALFFCIAMMADHVVAIYVTGDVSASYKKVIGSKFVSAITQVEGFRAVERTADFLESLQKEQDYQRTGNVSVNKIASIGSELGANFVIVTDVTYFEDFKEYYTTARLIEVGTNGVLETAEDRRPLTSMDALDVLSRNLSKNLITSLMRNKDKYGGTNSNTQSNTTGSDKLTNGNSNSGNATPPPVVPSYTPKQFTVNGVSFTMVPIQGGPFLMGATYEQGSDYKSDERPTHQVTLSDYMIGQTEVTQELWTAVMGNNYSKFKGAKHPVETVSWDECQEFLIRLNNLTGQKFRLPTEAEWEYAARGGKKSRGFKYSGSNTIDEVAVYDRNYGSTHEVATKQPNELGLYDMSGNVWEWCADWFGDYSSSAQTDPTGPTSGSYRVGRGGGWGNTARGCRVSDRYGGSPSNRYYDLGLRLAM